MKNEVRSLRDGIGPIFFIVAAAILSAGFANIYTGASLCAISTALLLWWYFKKPGWNLLPPVLLVLVVSTAAGGVLLGTDPALMIAGAAAALAGWELTEQHKFRFGGNSRILYDALQRTRLRLVMTAIVLGLSFSEAGLLIHFALPFWVVFLAGLLILFSLYRLTRILIV
jgi:hypothetical protein